MINQLLNQILTEELLKEEAHKYSYGCLMLKLNLSNWKGITKMIDPNDLYTEKNDDGYGIEDEPHVTILYGLLDTVSIDQIKEITNTLKSNIKLTIKNVSLFENDKFDVLKFGVESEDLEILNKLVKKLPNEDKYPKYVPHITIAYIKSGQGKKYINKIKAQKIEGNEFTYSSPDKEKTTWKIK